MHECCTAKATRELRDQVLQDLPRLMGVHPTATTSLLETHFYDQRRRVLDTLAHLPELQFAYLKGIVQNPRAPPEVCACRGDEGLACMGDMFICEN